MKHPVLVLVATPEKVLEMRLFWTDQPLTFSKEEAGEQLLTEGDQVEVLDCLVLSIPPELQPASAALQSFANFHTSTLSQDGTSFHRLLECLLTQQLGFSIEHWRNYGMYDYKAGRMSPPVLQSSELLPRG